MEKKEIDEFGKKEVDENVNVRKKTITIFIIIILLIVIVLSCWCGFMLGRSSYNDVSDETVNSELNDEEKKLTINDKEVLDLYYKFHYEKSGSLKINSMYFENYIYTGKVFEVKNMKEITGSLANLIRMKIGNKLDAYINYEGPEHSYILEKDAKDEIEKHFYDMFGDNLQFNNKLFASCNTYHYENGKYYLETSCGDVSPFVVNYKLTDVKTDENNLYLFEDVSFENPEGDYIERTKVGGSYKWTFNKGADGKYHLLKIELHSNKEEVKVEIENNIPIEDKIIINLREGYIYTINNGDLLYLKLDYLAGNGYFAITHSACVRDNTFEYCEHNPPYGKRFDKIEGISNVKRLKLLDDLNATDESFKVYAITEEGNVYMITDGKVEVLLKNNDVDDMYALTTSYVNSEGETIQALDSGLEIVLKNGKHMIYKACNFVDLCNGITYEEKK